MTYLSGVAVDQYRNMEGEDFVYFFIIIFIYLIP